MSKFVSITLLIISSFLFSQNQRKIDSLIFVSTNSASDSQKINVLHELVSLIEGKDLIKAIEIAEVSVRLSEQSGYKIEKSYTELAWLYKNTADYKKSLACYYKLEKYTANLSSPLKEQVLAELYTGLSSVYSNLNNYDLAIAQVNKAILSYAKLRDTTGIAVSNLNLGNYYYNKGDYKNAYKKYKIAETEFLSHDDTMYLNFCYNSLGSVTYQLQKYKDALNYYNKSYELSLKNNPNDLLSIAASLQNIGQVNVQLGNFEGGIRNCIEAAELFAKLNDVRNLYNTYEALAEYYSKINDFKTSNLYYSKYVYLKDSIFDDDTKSTIHEMSIKYESEKKEQENQLLTLENKNKKQIIYFALGGCFLLLGLVFFIFNGYRNKQKANLLLEEKNNIIQQQKEIVEEQHQDITDSIKYAKRIQGAILPPRNLWTKISPNSFVLYMPKDVLSGDFYWIEETKDYIYLAAADCTGHGVPGALISIVNFNLLNKAVLEKNLVTPAEILDAVNLWLTDSLHQTYRESAVKDGMDVTLIAIHKHSSEVLFSGANNPIYLVSNGELNVIKGDKFPVGAFIEDQIKHFTNKRFEVKSGDCIYLFSDGFADQFGGDNGKKYKYAPFQRKLIEIVSKSVSEQREIMKHEFLTWKGKHEQVDDVLLIGIKIS